MAEVDAPWPERMTEIEGKSVLYLERTATNLLLRNRAGEVVLDEPIRNPRSVFTKAIAKVGSIDVGYRDTLLKDWYRAGRPNVKMAAPATLPTGVATSAAWSPDSRHLAIGHTLSPYLSIYLRNGDTLTKLANPQGLPTSEIYSVAYSHDGQYLVAGGDAAPYLKTYRHANDQYLWFETVVTDSLTGAVNSVSFSPNDLYLAVGVQAVGVVVFKVNGGSPSKLVAPVDPPQSDGAGVSWSPDNSHLAVAGYDKGGAAVFKLVNDVLVRLPDLPGTTGQIGTSLAYSPDGEYLSVAINAAPFVVNYKRSGDTYTKMSNLDVLPPDITLSCAWSPDGQYLLIGHNTAPYMTIYRRKGDVFTKLPNTGVSSLPAGAVYGAAWTADGAYLATAHEGAPLMSVYKSAFGPIQGAAVRVF